MKYFFPLFSHFYCTTEEQHIYTMSTLTLHPHEQTSSSTNNGGPQHSYYFYKELSLKSNNNSLLRQPKQIIPSIPRQHL